MTTATARIPSRVFLFQFQSEIAISGGNQRGIVFAKNNQNSVAIAISVGILWELFFQSSSFQILRPTASATSF